MQEGKDCLLMALAPASRKKPLCEERLFSLAGNSLLIAPGRSLALAALTSLAT